MNKNMNIPDRIIRFLIAALFIGLYAAGIIPGILGIVLTVVAVVFLFTSFFSYCPIYGIFGWRTNRKPTE